ncbi:Potassium-transporting ATPase C chain [Salmonella enterica subsp. enterica serovar Montevideo str. S5-403]|uniref:Potassium-transporting ATPase C chain n=1 Tax=Salmonella enterica subsp. enterica serovar Montevideo str. S5-403 TaxID=913242 RepID=G5PZU1_SALMO|nr:Potassium-transporting ATPase C chain [Salmonella enterica subsp. enterica serovar Montevideo str. S5-403]
MIGLRPAFSTMLFLLLLTGGVYPLLTTALGQWWFPWQANGSLIHKDNVIRGSALIGQSFTAAGYFHGRPSATADTPYNPLASGGSNLAASNPELDAQIQARVAALRAANAAAWQIPRRPAPRHGKSPAWRRLASFPLNRSRNWLQNIRTGRWRAFLGNRW